MSSYCGYYAKGRCKFGRSCRHSHDEKDSPAVRKRLLETKLQLALICVLCNVKIVESGVWFGLSSTCSHPFCFPCAKKNSLQSSPPKSKKSKKTMRNECPECQKPLGNICPSGLFLEGKEKEKALEYFGNHELSIWDSYANRDRRTAKCGFSNCSKSILLDDGTEMCAHGQFNQHDLDAWNQQKKLEKQQRIEHELKIDWIKKTSRSVKDMFFFIFLLIITPAIAIFILESMKSIEFPLQKIEFWSTIPNPVPQKPHKFIAAYPEIRSHWVGDNGFGDEKPKLIEAKNSNNVISDYDISDNQQMCLWHYSLNNDAFYEFCGSEEAVENAFTENFNY